MHRREAAWEGLAKQPCAAGGRYLGDMWILHLDSLTWEAVTPKAAQLPEENGNSAAAVASHLLPPSAGHAMAAWKSKLLIVGGHMKVPSLSSIILTSLATH